VNYYVYDIIDNDYGCHRLAALWGLDMDGVFIGERTTSSLWSYIFPPKDSGVVSRIQQDMRASVVQADRERNRFATVGLSERELSVRLLFHFQKDLLTGLSEMLLETQDSREHIHPQTRSVSVKIVCSLFLSIELMCMVFYVFLFGLTKDPPHQQAWAKSFVIWLVMEIVLFASMMVLVNQVLIPMWTMKDLRAVRVKALQTISQHQRRVNSRRTELTRLDEPDQQAASGSSIVKVGNDDSGCSFNAAKYFFVSHRLASGVPDMTAAQLILQYVTPWPRQSYRHSTEAVTTAYSKKYSAIYTAITQVLLFFLFGFFSSPAQLQDLCVHLLSTVVLGYVMLLHMQLYVIYPVLVVVPSLLVVAVVYVLIQQKPSSKIHSSSLSADIVSSEPPPALDRHPLSAAPMSIPMLLSSPTTTNPHLNRRQSLQMGVLLLTQSPLETLPLFSLDDDVNEEKEKDNEKESEGEEGRDHSLSLSDDSGFLSSDDGCLSVSFYHQEEN
jgi:hypothetical protein